MSRLLNHFPFVLLLLLSFNYMNAQSNLELSVDQAIQLALKNSKSLNSSLMKVRGAEAKASEANTLSLPSVKLSAAYRRISEVDPFTISTPFGNFDIAPVILDNYSAQLSLTQPLFTGSRISSGIEIAEYSAVAANEEYIKDKAELVFSVRNAYWSLYKSAQLKKVFDETLEMVKAHLEDAKNLEKAGFLTRNDILRFEVQYSDAKFKQAEAENALQISRVYLNSIVGIPLNSLIETKSEINLSIIESEELTKLINEASEKRPELKAASLRVRASESAVTMAKSSWYPQIGMFANFYYSKPNQRIFPAQNKFNDTWDAGVSLNINVWDWLSTSYQTQQAEAQYSQANDAVWIIKDAITLEVTQNYLTLNQSKKKIELAAQSVEQAEENLRVTSSKFKNGLATSSDLIDAETSLTNAKFNYTVSLVDYELSKAKLDKSLAKEVL
ncbi:MAG: TolC family protein [Melioribacteraceae bacterium]|nr:TolC family protein [Melioribacteraceae bacterium]